MDASDNSFEVDSVLTSSERSFLSKNSFLGSVVQTQFCSEEAFLFFMSNSLPKSCFTLYIAAQTHRGVGGTPVI